MKKTRKIGVSTALFVIVALAAQAQSTPPPANNNQEFRLSVGPDFALPIGNIAHAYSWSFGGSVQADIPMAQNLYVVITAGYTDVFVKSKEIPGRNIQMIPVKAGVKYFLLDNFLYIQGQAGATFLGNKSALFADKSTAFSYAPQIGVLLKLGGKDYIDAGFRYEEVSSFYTDGSHENFLGLRLAWSFGL
jgi:Outer membrane protein beta-barrel domain